MFNLASQIRSWREHLAGEGVYSPSDLDELEAHLREEMVILVGKGLSEQEALAVARMRVGDPKELAQEFAKVNAGLVFKRRLFWMGLGVLGMGFAGNIANALSRGTGLAAASTGMRGYPLAILTESVHVSALVLAILGLLVLIKRSADSLTAPAWLHSTRGRAGLFVGLAALGLALPACQGLFTAGTVRLLVPSDMGQMALIGVYVNLLLTITWSLLLIGLVVNTWSSVSASPRSSN